MLPAFVRSGEAQPSRHGSNRGTRIAGRALTADFSAPSAGRPPWAVYRITARRATGLLTVEPGGATTWQF